MAITPGITASRSRIAPFRLHRPTTVEEACDCLRRLPDAAVHAGGIDLVNRMKGGLEISEVIALGGVAALKGVRRTEDGVEIGAATRHWEVEHDPLLQSLLPSIPEFVSGLGNIRIRMQGTVGGNIMAGEPGYEMLPLLAALDAKLCFVSGSGRIRHTVPARSWGEQPDTGELLLSVFIPVNSASVAWDRSLRPMLGLVAALSWDGQAAVSGYAALTGQGPIWRPIPVTSPVQRADLVSAAQTLAEHWAADLPDIDVKGGPDRHYCRRVAAVMLARALTRMSPP